MIPNRYHSHHHYTTTRYRFFKNLFVCATKKVPNRYISHDLRYIFDIFHAPPPPLKKKNLPILVPIWYFFGTVSLALLASSERQALAYLPCGKNALADNI